MSQLCETEIYRACRTLFGPELQLSRNFLSYLQPAGVRSAYRRQAKQVHPDLFAVAPVEVRQQQQHRFQDLNQAHQTIQQFLKLRRHNRFFWPQAEPRTPCRPAPHQPRQAPVPEYNDHMLPPRPLEFGQFLSYLGLVSFNDLIQAIVWQRRQRPKIGEVAQRWGWLTEEQIRRVVSCRAKGQRFGEKAQQLGLLSSLQVRTLLFHQRTRQKQLGRYFVEQGFFSEAALQQLLIQLAEHNRKHCKDFSSYFYVYHR